jgi:SHS2 domain-containing protein
VTAGSYEVIDHTADIGIIARGRDLNELFNSAARGMLHLLTDEGTGRQDVRREINLEAGDTETLLVEWLNELLYLLDTERLLLFEFDVFIEGGKLSAKCRGMAIDRRTYTLKREIKAATYHDLRIIKDGSHYSAKIIFDI